MIALEWGIELTHQFHGPLVVGTDDDPVRSHEVIYEQLAVLAEDVGGNVARRVRYHPVSGRCRLMRMPMTGHLAAEELARKRAQELEQKPPAPNIELF